MNITSHVKKAGLHFLRAIKNHASSVSLITRDGISTRKRSSKLKSTPNVLPKKAWGRRQYQLHPKIAKKYYLLNPMLGTINCLPPC